MSFTTNNVQNMPEPLKMSENARLEFLAFFQKAFSGGNDGKCFFRRVSEVSWLDKPYSVTKNIDPSTSLHVDSFTGISNSDRDRYMEVKVPFNAFTVPNSVRDEPIEVNKLKIRLPHTHYSQLDLTLNYTFEFSDDKRLCSPTTPIPKDLVFIYMSNQNLQNLRNSRYQPTADKWFVASEQFLRAWTAIMYKWHVSFDEFVSSIIEEDKKEDNLKDKLFGGNRLMTNTWLKFKMAINRPLSLQESRDKYWHLRSETASKKWVDVYCAIVLMARYGELPCHANLPDYKGKESSYGVEIHRSSWYFPVNFVTKLIGCVTPGLITEANIQNYKEWTNLVDFKYFLSDIDKGHKGVVDNLPLLNKNFVFGVCSDKHQVFQTIAPRTKKEEFPLLTSTHSNKQKEEFPTLTSVPLGKNTKKNKTETIESLGNRYYNNSIDTIESIGDRYYDGDSSVKNVRVLDNDSWSNMLKTLQVEPVETNNKTEVTLSISPRTNEKNTQITFTSVVDGNQHQEITVTSSEQVNDSSRQSPRKITITQTTTPKKITNNRRPNPKLQYVQKHRDSPPTLSQQEQTPTPSQTGPLNQMSPNTRRTSNKSFKILMSISWTEAEEDESY